MQKKWILGVKPPILVVSAVLCHIQRAHLSLLHGSSGITGRIRWFNGGGTY
jgi:hypothetical protein